MILVEFGRQKARPHHRLPGRYIAIPPCSRSVKTKNLSQHTLLGQEHSCGATRLGAKRPLFTYGHTRLVVNGGNPLRRPYSGHRPFLLALGSPFGLTLSAALAAPAALCGKGGRDLLTLLHRFGCMIPLPPPSVKDIFQRFKAKRTVGAALDSRPQG